MNIHRNKVAREVYLAYLLYNAIEDAELSSIELLLSTKGANPNVVLPKQKITPFHLIIGNDSEEFAMEVTQLILQHGGNPNVRSEDGLTPVHIAAAWGRYDLLSLLLCCGGDPEARDANRNTPLYYAAKERFENCFNVLLKFVPDQAALLYKEKEDGTSYDLILDKILVNNGTTVGEYEILNEYKTTGSVQKKNIEKLQELPLYDSKESVMTWVQSHPQLAKISGSSVLSLPTSLGASPMRTPKEIEPSTPKRAPKKVANRPSNCNSRKPKAGDFSDSESEVCTLGLNYTSPKKCSAESGVGALQTDSEKRFVSLDEKSNLSKIETSSDYLTCSANSCNSTNILERNIFEIADDSLLTNDETKSVLGQNSVASSVATKSEGIGSSDLSFVSVSEIYKYVDQDEGVVLYEKRLLRTPISDCNKSVKSCGSMFSNKSSLPETFDYEEYDSDILRKELTLHGYNPGPITVTTKRVYLKKLKQLHNKQPMVLNSNEAPKKVYSTELQNTLKNPEWHQNTAEHKLLDLALFKQFHTPDASRKWREGINKSSFTYLLLDSRITNNLPCRADTLNPSETWENFLSAIFYVGKGKRSRPYSHLYDAVSLWNRGKKRSDNKKLDKILDIWGDNCGVVCVHVFQNIIPVEAYTREAAMISALDVSNLCNVKSGDFYGVAATWSRKDRAKLGVFLLYKAMKIFLNEGERQLWPTDID